ncbi:MAG: MogA/MoaB family molybdenum cofactor biosynthesis protein [Anaerolineales bacterium]|jgi:molybdenum cofactor synthesis domain-containing protein
MALRFAILTVSDRSARGERPDLSGPALADLIAAQGWQVVRQAVVPDERVVLEETMSTWVDQDDLDILLTTGGTGFSLRDITPEATRAVIEREAPGLVEAMRQESLKVTPHAMLSRAVAGIRGKVLIINLPGSPKGALENIQLVLPVLPHAVELLRGEPDAEQHH